jgi:serine/threonine-protein kinase
MVLPFLPPMTPKEKQLLQRALGLLGSFSLVAFICGTIAMKLTELHQPMIVPRIIGMDQSQAQETLGSKALKLKIIRSQFDEHIPANLIMMQSPPANTYMRRGQTVQVVLSKGNPKVKIPMVTGLSYEQAQILLAANHLRVGRESFMDSGDPKDTVLAQTPQTDETVESFTGVNLLVSNGPPEPFYIMPDLNKKSLETALKVLRPAGIAIQNIKTEVHDDLESETILAQDPPSGTKLQTQDQVSLTVSAKSSDENLKPRYVNLVFDMPDGNPRRLQIDVFDSTGTRTVYNKMESPKDHVEVGVTVSGKASAEIYLNQEFVKEIPAE